MNLSIKQYGILSASVILILCFYYISANILDKAKTAAASSTAAAICEALIAEKDNDIIKNINIDSQEKVLSDYEYDQIINHIALKHNLDARPGWKIGEPLLDSWNKRFQIVIGKDKDGSFNAKVRFSGSDGMFREFR